MFSLRTLSCGLRKREKIKLWHKPQGYKRIICQCKKKIRVARKNGDIQGQLKYTSLLVEIYYLLKLYAHVIDYSKRCIDVAKAVGDKPSELKACYFLVKTYDVQRKYDADAIYYSELCTKLAEEVKEKKYFFRACYLLIKAYGLLNQYDSAVIYAKKYLKYSEETGDKEREFKACYLLIIACDLLKQYDKNTTFYCQKCIDITEKTGDKKIKLKSCLILVKTYEYLQQYDEVAISYCKKCLYILKEAGNNPQIELKTCYLLLRGYDLLEKYDYAIPYVNRYMEIAENTTDTLSERECHYFLEFALKLAKALFFKKNYDEAVTYCKKCVEIASQMDDKRGLTKTYLLLGRVYYSLNQYNEAIVYCRKCILMELFDDKQDEIDAYSILVEAHCFQQNYDDAITNGKRCIRRAHETKQEHALTDVYYFIGEASYFLNRYDDAIKYCEEGIAIATQNDNKSREIESCLLLAKAFYERQWYDAALVKSKKCIHIANQEGNKLSEMGAHLLAGKSCFSLKYYEEASFYVKKCIKMAQENGHLKFELDACIVNARLFHSKGSTRELVSAIAQSLVLAEELRDSPAKRSVVEIIFAFLEQQDNGKNSMTDNSKPEFYQTLVSVVSLGNEKETMKKIEKLMVLHERYVHQVQDDECTKAIATLKQIADIDLNSIKIFLKSFCHQKMGCLYLDLDQKEEAISQLRNAIDCAEEVGPAVIKNKIILNCSRILGMAYFKSGETEQSIFFLRKFIGCIDFFVESMEADENTIIDFIDKNNDCYNYLAKALIKTNRIQEALLVLEQRTARALKEQLMSRHEINKTAQERHKDHLTYCDIMSLVSRNKYSILFCSVFPDCMYTFLVEEGTVLQFRQFSSPKADTESLVNTMLESFAINKKIRTLSDMDINIISHENSSCDIDQDIVKAVGRILAYFGCSPRSRTPKEPCENVDVGSITNDLEILYHNLFGKMSIKQDEIVIIPDGPLYKVPFAALRDPDTGRYLSETKRIRIAPSIKTLKLLQEIPVDQNKNPALVVGNPLVGEVMLDGEKKNVRPLSAAFREANAVSSIHNVMPLTEGMATKQAVTERLQRELALVHIAGHGCFNNGTILLAPTPASPETRRTMIPVEKDYMLTMDDVQRARVLAPLVVLSCCHTGLGEIKAEGVVGICRAFLASGARAVVASLWAIHDQATSEFMGRFHRHLKAGKSTSTSLQQTMKEMRQIPIYSDPKYWAPFFLLGDDVTINC